LVEGFAKMQRIFGNPAIDLLDSSLCSEWQFKKVLAMEEFSVDLQPEILYQRVE
jgi:hypothetical protein